jgi:hypothetical protein
MDVKAYMDDDLNFIDGLVSELEANINKWPSEKVMDRSKEMFDAFYRRFALEDFLLKHIKPSAEMQAPLKKFLDIRGEFRANLENILMLHIDEPEFLVEIGRVHKAVIKHMSYLKEEFDPNFLNKVAPEQMAQMSADLEKKLKVLSFT